MKPEYLIGAGVSAVAGIVTLLAKSALTKYPGIGDITLLWLVGTLIGERGQDLIPDGRSFLYVAKALLAVGVFSLLYFAFKSLGQFRLLGAISITLCVLILMSLGEAVIG